MNINNDERRVIILTRLSKAKARLESTISDYEQMFGGSIEHQNAREKLRVRLNGIADELGKACD